MPAIVKILQINDAVKRKSIIAAIRAETDALPISYEVSLLKCADRDLLELVIKPPEGGEIYRTLDTRKGDLAPQEFRARIRELINGD